MDDKSKEQIEKCIVQNYDKNLDKFKLIIIELVEEIQSQAFMEGYMYAIKILEDGLIVKEKTN